MTALGIAWLASACKTETASPTPTAVASGVGKLAYVLDGDIWVKDLPDGAPRRITHDGHDVTPKWSPSGEWLSYKEGNKLGVMRAGGSDARLYDAGWIAWSPVADRIAFTPAQSAIVVENADGTDRKVVASAHDASGLTANLAEPAWNVDGTSIAYAEQRSQIGTPPTYVYSGIWQVPADGSTPATEVYNTGSPPSNGVGVFGWPRPWLMLIYAIPGFAADISDGITLQELRPTSGTAWKTVEIAPANPVMLLESEMSSPVPAGDLVAITDGGGRETWTNKRIAVVSLAGGAVTDLTDVGVAAIEPSWSPAGQRIAYAVMPDAGPSVSGGDAAKAVLAQRKIWVTDTYAPGQYGANRRQLTRDPAYRDEYPRWSADGSQIIFARLDALDRWSLWMMKADGTDLREVIVNFNSSTVQSDATWFGYYGHIPWDNVLDWWRGAPATADARPVAPGATPAEPPAATVIVNAHLPTTGNAALDRVITRLQEQDVPGLVESTSFLPTNCSIVLTVGSGPACPPGVADGTPVGAFLVAQCEGSHLTSLDQVRDAYATLFAKSVRSSVYAVTPQGLIKNADGFTVILTPGDKTSPTAPYTIWYMTPDAKIIGLFFECGIVGAALTQDYFGIGNAGYLISPQARCSPGGTDILVDVETIQGVGGVRPQFLGAESTLDGAPAGQRAIVDAPSDAQWVGLPGLSGVRPGMRLRVLGRRGEDCVVAASAVTLP